MGQQDRLEVLAGTRRSLIAAKTRDYASDRGVSRTETVTVLDVCTGQPIQLLGRDDFNAKERAFQHSHRMGYYKAARSAALTGAPIARLRMVEAAIRCDVASREAASAWRLAA